MLLSTNDLQDYAIRASDGDIGHVKDVYFDDQSWVIRYLVVDTGAWLVGRKVLISPLSIRQPNWIERVLPVSLTQLQVKDSPDIDTEKPVSRQNEIGYLAYYNYPYYWGMGGLWGTGMYPELMIADYASLGTAQSPSALDAKQQREDYDRREELLHQNDDLHLRSCKAVTGYHIHATDGDIGHVQGMLIDQETWAIRYLIVNTSNWWLGHQILLAPQWIQDISWEDSTVSVNLKRQIIKEAPIYDANLPLGRLQEIRFHEHYGRLGYWVEEDKHSSAREK